MFSQVQIHRDAWICCNFYCPTILGFPVAHHHQGRQSNNPTPPPRVSPELIWNEISEFKTFLYCVNRLSLFGTVLNAVRGRCSSDLAQIISTVVTSFSPHRFVCLSSRLRRLRQVVIHDAGLTTRFPGQFGNQATVSTACRSWAQ